MLFRAFLYDFDYTHSYVVFYVFFFFLPIPYFLRDFDLSILQSVGITM